MTRAKFEYSREDGFIKMDVKGHAGFAEIGKDPVCAGISIMALTVAQVIEIMRDEGKLQKEPRIVIRNGHVAVTAKPKPEAFNEALHVFYVAETGMALVAQAYPDNVDFNPFILPSDEG